MPGWKHGTHQSSKERRSTNGQAKYWFKKQSQSSKQGLSWFSVIIIYIDSRKAYATFVIDEETYLPCIHKPIECCLGFIEVSCSFLFCWASRQSRGIRIYCSKFWLNRCGWSANVHRIFRSYRPLSTNSLFPFFESPFFPWMLSFIFSVLPVDLVDDSQSAKNILACISFRPFHGKEGGFNEREAQLKKVPHSVDKFQFSFFVVM
jgi:hypothetical protein